MTLPRPRSLSSLLLIGLLLLVVPLAVAVVQAATQLRQLARDTDQLVRQGVELSRGTQSLFRYIASYERSANLYVLLGDPRLLEANRTLHGQIVETTDQIAALQLDEDGARQVGALRRAAQGVLALLECEGPEEPDRAGRLAGRLEDLDRSADAVSAAANRILETRLARLEEGTSATERRLLLWLGAMVPAFLVLGLAFAFGVLRPLRQVDQAITELGHGRFSRPISISGPSDIEVLGGQLEWLRLRLLELAQEKNRFLRHMSHDLKTPLANIREGTDLLLEGAVGELEPQQREVTGILRDSGLRLQQLIENLLSFSAWQSHTTQLDLSRFSLSAVIKAAFEAQRMAVSTRQLTIYFDLQDVEIQADRAKLRLVFDNLLSNALKFTPMGGAITVRTRRSRHDIVIDFADSGPGVPANERERIFDAFYTGSTPQAGPVKGSGIGLSVVVEYVAAHGGQVELASGEFPGAHFRVHLPLDTEAASRREAAARA